MEKDIKGMWRFISDQEEPIRSFKFPEQEMRSETRTVGHSLQQGAEEPEGPEITADSRQFRRLGPAVCAFYHWLTSAFLWTAERVAEPLIMKVWEWNSPLFLLDTGLQWLSSPDVSVLIWVIILHNVWWETSGWIPNTFTESCRRHSGRIY